MANEDGALGAALLAGVAVVCEGFGFARIVVVGEGFGFAMIAVVCPRSGPAFGLPEFPFELAPEFPFELPPEFPFELPPELPFELPPEFPFELPPELPAALPADSPLELRAELLFEFGWSLLFLSSCLLSLGDRDRRSWLPISPKGYLPRLVSNLGAERLQQPVDAQ